MSKPESPPPNDRLVGFRFVRSVPFAGTELEGIMLERGKLDSITPVRIESDGRAVRIGENQRCDGFALEREYTDRLTNKPRRERVVVGIGGIMGYIYGPAEAKPDATK